MSTNKHFYLLDENNNISSFADYKFDKNALEAQDEIIQGYDGRYYFASQCPQQPLEELKLIKREEINQARDAAEQGGFEYMGKIFPLKEFQWLRRLWLLLMIQQKLLGLVKTTPQLT